MTARFRPSALSTLVLATLAATFVLLGNWQDRRATAGEELHRAFDFAPSLSELRPDFSPPRYARVELTGRFDSERHFLVDNRIHEGKAGVHVLTPFRVVGDRILILVNRGWLPMPADRRSLPAVPTPNETMQIRGHLAPLGHEGPKLGSSDRLITERWPQLLTYPDLPAMGKALNEELYPLVLFLNADHLAGFEGREWRPVYMTPSRHRAYAWQWYALAVTVAGAWVALGIIRGRKSSP